MESPSALVSAPGDLEPMYIPSVGPRVAGNIQPALSPAAPPQPQRKHLHVAGEMKELPKIELATDRTKRAHYDSLADHYSLIIALQHIETAYVRDAISADDYTRQCQKLLAQYKTHSESLMELVPSIEQFMQDYDMKCKAALNRIREGVPATVLHGGGHDDNKGNEVKVFQCSQHFITLMDSLKLGMKAVDEVHPHLSDLMDSLTKVGGLSPDHESKLKVKDWLLRLGRMKAHEELSPDDVRQMSFDIESAYNSFYRWLQQKKS